MGFMGNHGKKGIINSSSFIDREFDLAKPADWADWLTGKKAGRQVDKQTRQNPMLRVDGRPHGGTRLRLCGQDGPGSDLQDLFLS